MTTPANVLNISEAGYVVFNGTSTFSGRTFQAGTGISLVNASGVAGNTTITASGSGGFTWENIGASQTLEVFTGYFCSTGDVLSLSLPLTSAEGDTIEVVLDGSTRWIITQGAGQRIRLGNLATTTGAGGSITSTLQGDSIRLVCQTANTFWVAVSSVGSFTFV